MHPWATALHACHFITAGLGWRRWNRTSPSISVPSAYDCGSTHATAPQMSAFAFSFERSDL